ncbi:MAG: hypothetical protein AAF235_02135 [Planctomycetota bacterium]
MPSQAPDFDALAFDASSGVNKTGETAFIRAAGALAAWHFVGVDTPEEPGEYTPLIAAIAGEPHLLAFTDAGRAESFAARRATQRGGEPMTLHMDGPDAIEYCRALAEQGVWGVHFNDGDHAVSVQIDRMLAVVSA